MDYKEILEAKYNRSAWITMLQDIFRQNVVFFATPAPVAVNSDIANHAYYLGKITLTDNQQIAIYEVQLTHHIHIEHNKATLRNLLVKDWRNSGFAGAFMLCYRSDKSVLRFSYVSENYRFDENQQYKKFATDTKRYTYLLGEGRACRTANERFVQLRDSAQTLDDVTRAFSVEALTKQFYNELFDWYSWAVSDETGVYFPNNVNTVADDRENIETKVIRLITRVMFVWFIKQKDLVPGKLFDVEFLKGVLKDFNPMDAANGNYYNAILQNLFFATLNRAIVDEDGNKRSFAYLKGRDIKNLYRYAEMFSISEQEVIDMFSSVPFLNGGLFECLDKTKQIDGVEVAYNYDGFSRNDKRFANGRYRNRAFIPNILFFEPKKGVFSILSRYNFTIEENTPDDQQVALDPELLGKVFENLLGAYNPETRETARNQSGSFYTPREIVNYMVDESLISYLGDNEVVRSVFEDNFVRKDEDEDAYKEITQKLKAIKVLDPACGSGAFPMGMLNRIVDILRKLNVEDNVYQLKLHVIENCIYGCDIQSIAAQITKLRFFISLICDCDKDLSKPNFGMPTLPNLETKFVSADSLIKIKKVLTRDLFEDPRIEETKNKLKEIRHKHFNAKTASRKATLRKKDEQLRLQLAELLKGSEVKPEDAVQLAKWNPYDQNEVSPFFDPEWMFGIKDGFDIVIGNPPYVQLQNNGGALAMKYENQEFKTFARTGDEYCLFYERGWQLLKEGGHLCFITSNKWMRAGYGEKTRAFFAKNTNPMLLIDFAGVKIFDSATVDTNILLFGKERNQKKTICAVTSKENKDSVKNLSVFVQQSGSVCEFSNSDSWVILSPIEQSIKRKIEAVGTPLKDWDIQINYGIKTGFNDAFIINTEKRDEILSNCQTEDERTRTAELIRPILRGRDIKRYGYNWAGLYLIATFPSRHYDIEKYPAVKNYLLGFGIERLEQTGMSHTVNGEKIKARKKTNNKWFETQDSISYWEDFSKPKVLWKRVGSILRFCYNDNEALGLDSTCFAIGNNIEFVCCVLNTPMGHYLLKDAPKTGTGDLLISVQAVEPIKLPSVTHELNIEFKRLLEMMIANCSDDIENEISQKIFNLYGLSHEEQRYIEENFT
jgi:hypothetical protein